MKNTFKRFMAGCLAAVMMLSAGAFAAEPQEDENQGSVPEVALGQPGPDQPELTPDLEPSKNETVSADNSSTSEDTSGMETPGADDDGIAVASEGDTSPVTYDSDKNEFFANGVPITISDNGSGKTVVSYEGGSTELTNPADTIIYGGSQSGSVASTSVTMESGTVKHIFGGGYTGSVTGKTKVVINGGTVNYIFGGGDSGNVDSTEVEINNVTANFVHGGGLNGQVTGSASVLVKAGNIAYNVYGGGYETGAYVQNASVIFQGGTAKYIYGGGYKGSVASAQLTMSAGTVNNNVYGGGWNGQVTNTTVTFSGGTIGTSNNVGGLYGGGQGGAVANSHVIVMGGSVPMVCGDSKTVASNGATTSLELRGGQILTARGGSDTAASTGIGRINVTVSGRTAGEAVYIKQLILGENVSGGTSNVNFTMTGGRVDTVYKGYFGSIDSAVIQGGNIVDWRQIPDIKFYSDEGKSTQVYPVSIMANSAGEGTTQSSADQKDLSLLSLIAVTSTSENNKAHHIQVTINDNTWFSSLGDNGHLNVFLPAAQYSAGKLVVNFIQSDGQAYGSYQNMNAHDTVTGEYDANAIFIGQRDSVTVKFGSTDESRGSVSADTVGGGSGSTVTSGQAVTFTAVPKQGYALEYWWVNGVKLDSEGVTTMNPLSVDISTPNTLKLNARTDVEVEASFTKQGTVQFGGSEKISGETGRSCVVAATVGSQSPVRSTSDALGKLENIAAGTQVSFTHDIPEEGYTFVAWREYNADGTITELEGTDTLNWTSTGTTTTIIAECVNKTKLKEVIDQATPIHTSLTTTDGGSDYSATSEDQTAFENAYNAAVAAQRDKVFQSAVDNAKAELERAMGKIKCKVKFSPDSFEGGSFTLSGNGTETNMFAAGVEVVIKPAAEAGYDFLDETNNPKKALTSDQVGLTWKDGQYSFTMPSSVVTIDVPHDFFTTTGYTVTYKVEKDTGNAVNGIVAVNGQATDKTTTERKLTGVAITQELVFTATPDTNYEVKEWSITNAGNTKPKATSAVSEDKTVLTLSQVNEDITVSVSFQLRQHKITIVNPGTSLGTVTVVEDESVVKESDGFYGKAGKTVTVTVEPETDGQLESITYTKTDGSTESVEALKLENETSGIYTYSFVMPNKATTINANFVKLYKIEVQKDQDSDVIGISVDSKDNVTQAPAGKMVIVTPERIGYTATDVTLTLSDNSIAQAEKRNDGKFQFKMPDKDVKVSVTFEVNKHTIDKMVVKGNEAAHDASLGEITLTANQEGAYDSEVQFTVDLKPGYEPITGTDSDKPVKVVDSKGTEINTLTGPDGNGVYSFKMPNDNVTITAKVEAISYKITSEIFGISTKAADKDKNVKITGSFGEVKNGTNKIDTTNPSSCAFGEKFDFSVTTLDGYELVKVKAVSGDTTVMESEPSNDGNYSFTMPAGEVVIQAEFKALEYDINVVETLPEHCKTLSVSSPSPAKAAHTDGEITENVNITVVAEPIDDTFVLESITLKDADNKETKYTLEGPDNKFTAGENNTYTLSYEMPMSNVTVSAEFVADMRTITTVSDSAQGSIVIAEGTGTGGTYQVQKGTQLHITITAEKGYQLQELQILPKEGTTETVSPRTNETIDRTVWEDQGTAVTQTGTPDWYWQDKYVYSGLTVDKDVTITAVFREEERGTYFLSTETTGSGKGSLTLKLIDGENETEITDSTPVAVNKTVKIVVTSDDSSFKSETLKVLVKLPDGTTKEAATITGDPGNSLPYTFTMPAGNVKVTAQFGEITDKPDISEGTGSGDDNVGGNFTKSVSGNAVTARLSANKAASSIKNGTLSLNANNVKTSSGSATGEIKYTTYILPANTVADLTESGKLENLELTSQADDEGRTATMTLDAAALQVVKEAIPENSAGKTVEIVLEKVDNVGNVEEDKQALLEGRPVYSFEVKVDGQKVSTFNGGQITLSIPYELESGETPEGVMGCYITDKGDVQVLLNSEYNESTGVLTITTPHLSNYGLIYIENQFKDLEGHWAESYVLPMSAMGLVNGMDEGVFSPDTALTRGMMVTILGRWAGVDGKAVSDTGFADVDPGQYYAPYVAWAKEAGVVNGTGEDTFSPEAPITRQELAVIMYRYAQQMDKPVLEETAAAQSFNDSAQISSWAKDAVNALCGAKIILGRDGSCFAPVDNASRAEVCTMLARFIKLVEAAQ